MTAVDDVVLDEIERLAAGQQHDPHGLLGARVVPGGAAGGDRVVIRGYRPGAVSMSALVGDERIPMQRIHGSGIFAAELPGAQTPEYLLEVRFPGDLVVTIEDPTDSGPRSGLSTFTCSARDGTRGCGGTWAPTCSIPGRHGHVICGWGPQRGQVSELSAISTAGTGASTRCVRSAARGSGSCSFPGSVPAPTYKYEVLTNAGHLSLRADPFAFRTEVPPATASIVEETRLRLGRPGLVRSSRHA